jgi:hypothetical protein
LAQARPTAVGANASHSALYAIGANDNVEVSVDGGVFTNLGGYAKQISAASDGVVYAIRTDNAVYEDNSLAG